MLKILKIKKIKRTKTLKQHSTRKFKAAASFLLAGKDETVNTQHAIIKHKRRSERFSITDRSSESG